MSDSVLIVGASMGGLRTAEALRRNGYEGRIDILGDEKHAPYNRPPLSKEVLAGSVSAEAVTFNHNLAESDTHFHLGTRAVRLDIENRTVHDQTDGEHAFSALVIATGLRPRQLNLPDIDAVGIHILRTLEDAMELRLELVPGAKVVIVGSGFIGCEVAATAKTLGCEVTVVTTDAHPMLRPLGMEMARELQKRHQAQGVQFITNTGVQDIETRDIGKGLAIANVILVSGQTIECDVLVQAIGSLPNTEWLSDSNINITDGVLTDGTMRAVTNEGEVLPNVFAVGDVARFPNPIFDDVARRVEHWNIPIETARRAGAVIAALLRSPVDLVEVVKQPFAPIPSFWSDQFDIKMLAFGNLGLADECRLIDGDIGGDCVWGYYRNDHMVGVCGIGMGAVVRSYRNHFTIA